MNFNALHIAKYHNVFYICVVLIKIGAFESKCSEVQKSKSPFLETILHSSFKINEFWLLN